MRSSLGGQFKNALQNVVQFNLAVAAAAVVECFAVTVEMDRME